jgi:AraC family transcriptional regulator, transcriptional activator of pobA
MKGITHYEGLYQDMDYKPKADYIFSELLETRSKNFDWQVEPHIHAHLFQVFYMKTGQVQFHGLAQVVDLPVPCILVIPPTVLHGFSYSVDTTGHILTLSETVIEPLFENLLAAAIRFETFQCISLSTETRGLFEKTVDMIGQIDEELFAERTDKNALLRAYLTQLFILLSRQLQINEQINQANESTTLQHFRAFQKSLKNSELPKSIPDFADELAISAVHLNRICHAVTGKSASQLVQENIIQKAQNYLTYTSYSVSEIAYLLKFEYPNYFAKLFKKHTGLSPKDFREKR